MVSTDYRLSYVECRDLLRRRVAEAAPARIQLLAGPRQVGKTTLVLELARDLGAAALYVAGDSPEAALPGFWERQWGAAEARAAEHGRAVVLLDEAHTIPEWSTRLKGEWDRIRRLRLPIQIVATGSSALHLGAGSRESLAGRFERLTLTHWSAASLSAVFGIGPDEAADLIVRLGGYPGAFAYRNDVARWSAYVRDAIVEPAIGRDIVALAVVRKPGLLRQVFSVCAASPAQILALQKIQGQLQDAGALETIAHYLQLLQEAFLLSPLAKHGSRATRRRAAPPKIVVLSNALSAVTDPAGPPGRETDPARFGAWVENACIAHAWNAGQHVSYWREEPLEIDAVLEGSWGSWAVEVKTGSISSADLRGLAEFTRRHRSFRPLVICHRGRTGEVARLGFEAIAWQEFLTTGPPK